MGYITEAAPSAQLAALAVMLAEGGRGVSGSIQGDAADLLRCGAGVQQYGASPCLHFTLLSALWHLIARLARPHAEHKMHALQEAPHRQLAAHSHCPMHSAPQQCTPATPTPHLFPPHRYLATHSQWFKANFFNRSPEGLSLVGGCMAAAGIELAERQGSSAAGAAGPSAAAAPTLATGSKSKGRARGRSATPPPAPKGQGGGADGSPSGSAAGGPDVTAAAKLYAQPGYGKEVADAARQLLAHVMEGNDDCKPGAYSVEAAVRLATLAMELQGLATA